MSTGAREELDENYARAGYHAAQVWGRRPALILIDFAQAYFEPTSPLFGGEGCRTALDFSAAAAASPRMNAAFRSSSPRSSIARAGPTAAFSSGRRRCCRVSWRAARPSAIADGLSPRDDEIVVAKQYPSAFFGTSLGGNPDLGGRRQPRHHRADDLGMRARDLRRQHEPGFITIVAREGVGDRDPRPHEANLYDMNAKYADVAPETRVADYFRSCAHWRSPDGR